VNPARGFIGNLAVAVLAGDEFKVNFGLLSIRGFGS
jgi:hypothetical protein